MTIIYVDVITTLLFFIFIFYIERKGVVHKNPNNLNFQQLNVLVWNNPWLYVLPYFYSITFLTDLETFLSLKSNAIQLIYFFVLMIIQAIIFLRMQTQSVFSYSWMVKEKIQKMYYRYSTKRFKDVTDEDYEKTLAQKRATKISIHEVSFLLNSFIFPLVFILTNSFYLTKIISFFS
jgi:hypothetical protein